MSVAKFFQPENRLAKAITAPGGKRVVEAVADADAGLAKIAGECLARVDALLARLAVDPAGALASQAALETYYRDAREIAGLAQPAGCPELGMAAGRLCGLIDHAQQGGRVTGEHLLVCTDVLRSLRAASAFSPAERAVVLAKLEAMVDKLIGKAAAAA